MKFKFVIIYGLPGAGKTTLCNKIAKAREDVVYVNLAEHPDFRKRDAIAILEDEITPIKNKPVHIITDGHFPIKAFRERMITKFKCVRSPISIFLRERPDVLCQRRKRSEEEYKILEDNLELTPDCVVMKTRKLKARVEAVSAILDS